MKARIRTYEQYVKVQEARTTGADKLTAMNEAEFVMPGNEAPQFKSLDEFTQGYVEALFFTESGPDAEDDIRDAGFSDFAPEALEKIKAECEQFQKENTAHLQSVDLRQAGMDFWLTRNGHGAGFWDGDYEQSVGDALTASSEKYGEVYVEVGDDGMVYVQ